MPVVETNMAAVEDPKASNALPRSFLNELSQQEVQKCLSVKNFLAFFVLTPKMMEVTNASEMLNIYPSWTWTPNWSMVKIMSYLTSLKVILTVKVSHTALEAGWAIWMMERRNAYRAHSLRVRLLL